MKAVNRCQRGRRKETRVRTGSCPSRDESQNLRHTGRSRRLAQRLRMQSALARVRPAVKAGRHLSGKPPLACSARELHAIVRSPGRVRRAFRSEWAVRECEFMNDHEGPSARLQRTARERDPILLRVERSQTPAAPIPRKIHDQPVGRAQTRGARVARAWVVLCSIPRRSRACRTPGTTNAKVTERFLALFLPDLSCASRRLFVHLPPDPRLEVPRLPVRLVSFHAWRASGPERGTEYRLSTCPISSSLVRVLATSARARHGPE